MPFDAVKFDAGHPPTASPTTTQDLIQERRYKSEGASRKVLRCFFKKKANNKKGKKYKPFVTKDTQCTFYDERSTTYAMFALCSQSDSRNTLKTFLQSTL